MEQDLARSLAEELTAGLVFRSRRWPALVVTRPDAEGPGSSSKFDER